MSHKIQGDGDVTADGKTWKLRFDMNVLADLEELTGKKATDVLAGLREEGGSTLLLRQVCHAMLARYHPEATARDAGNILSENVEGVLDVIMAAMPKPADGAPAKVQVKAGQRQ